MEVLGPGLKPRSGRVKLLDISAKRVNFWRFSLHVKWRKGALGLANTASGDCRRITLRRERKPLKCTEGGDLNRARPTLVLPELASLSVK